MRNDPMVDERLPCAEITLEGQRDNFWKILNVSYAERFKLVTDLPRVVFFSTSFRMCHFIFHLVFRCVCV